MFSFFLKFVLIPNDTSLVGGLRFQRSMSKAFTPSHVLNLSVHTLFCGSMPLHSDLLPNISVQISCRKQSIQRDIFNFLESFTDFPPVFILLIYIFFVGIVVLLVLCYVGYDYISITEELMEYEAKEKLHWDSEVYGYG